jgi:hypothetical protein
MALYFPLLSLSERIDVELREVEKLRRESEQALYAEDKAEIERSIVEHFNELLECKDKVLRLVAKERDKFEKKAERLEKKITRTEKKDKAERLRKALGYLQEQIEMIKGEVVDHLPSSLMSMAFIDESLQTGGDYFSIDFKNFFADFYFKSEPRRKRYDQVEIVSTEFCMGEESCDNFDIIYKGKAYMPYALEGLVIEKGETFTLRVYSRFMEGTRMSFVIDTKEFGVIRFEKVLKTLA